MSRKPHGQRVLLQCCLAMGLASWCSPGCHDAPDSSAEITTQNQKTVQNNPVVYFEIPVEDVARAQRFYTQVLGAHFESTEIDGHEMALFPFTAALPGITGALAKGPTYKPATTGTLVYFHTNSIDSTLLLATRAGAQILYPKTSNGPLGFVAEIQDSEGNRIGLHQPAAAEK